jgi:hypothetical protein
MTELATKEHVLKNAGYRYDSERRVYLNRESKTAFSLQFLEDNPDAEIESCLRNDLRSEKEWRFFFNEPPSAAVKSEVTNLLD